MLKRNFNHKFDNILQSKTIMLNKLNTFDTQFHRILQNKSNQLENLKNSFQLSNPENREKFGFVEITHNNKKILLNELKKGDNVELSNTKYKLLAKII